MLATFFRGLRSFLAILGIGFLFAVPGTLRMYLFVLPRVWAQPARRYELGSDFMRWMSRWILRIQQWGGAHFERSGTVPTGGPAYIVMNHQSQLDIPTAALMGEPGVPVFVSRARYTRFVPLVSKSIRLIGCPVVDPEDDPRGALDAIQAVAPALERGLLIFPEGHRSREGEVLPFRARGLMALLQSRPLPVYVIVNDGLWRARSLADTLFNAPLLRGEAEVLGPFQPPDDPKKYRAFVAELREKLVERITQMRARKRV